MEKPDRIHLRDHVVMAEIGAFQSERGRKQRLRFNLLADLSQPVTDAGDQVDAILSYDVLTQAVATALADQRYDLVETLAEKIAAEVLAHPGAARVEVSVEKLDRGPFALGVTIRRSKGRMRVSASGKGARLLLYQNPVALPSGPLVVVPDLPGLPLPPGGNRHRITLLALDQAAWALAGDLALPVVESRTELLHAVETGLRVIWAPARLARDAPAGTGADPAMLCFWLAERLAAQQIDIALPPDHSLPSPSPGLTVPVRRFS